jgi:hypothetical protein
MPTGCGWSTGVGAYGAEVREEGARMSMNCGLILSVCGTWDTSRAPKQLRGSMRQAESPRNKRSYQKAAWTRPRSTSTLPNMSNEERDMNPETQLASYFAKYEPAMAKLGKALRAKLRARLPGLSEFVYVYENQSALVISYTPTDHGSEGLCGIALYPDTLKLFFGQGAQLSKSDPSKLLQGSGKTVRHVVLNSVADFNRAEIEALIAAAVKLAKLRLDANAKGSVVIKAEEQKQRASRAKKTTRPASARRPPKARG